MQPKNDIKFDETFTFQTYMITVSGRECGRAGTRQGVFCTMKDGGYTCAGDSGGPAVADRDRDGTWVQYGLTSFGNGDCGVSTHTGFTDVAAYVETILAVVAQNS